MLFKRIKIELFDMEVVIAICKDFNEFYYGYANMHSQLGLTTDPEIEMDNLDSISGNARCAEGLTILIPPYGLKRTIYIKAADIRHVDIATVVHELYHATQGLLKFAGVKDEETAAFFIEYLYKEYVKWHSECVANTKRKRKH